MNGTLNVFKPRNQTSFTLVSMVKRLTQERRVGHAGTLDPMASGVLPVCLGQGTRVVEFLMDATKVYRACIELGVTTDTYDATGRVIRRADPDRVSQAQIEQALDLFRGEIAQTPPMYSAVKHQGQPLYRLARAGITVSRKSRPAMIYRLDLIDFEPPLVTLEIECSKGTYIRSLAHDLGSMLGCGAHLKELTRTRYGPFDITEAVSAEQLDASSDWQQLVYPVDFVLSHWPAVILNGDREKAVRNGGAVFLGDCPVVVEPEERCRAYSQDGRFLAVLCFDPGRGQWQPAKVFVKPAGDSGA